MEDNYFIKWNQSLWQDVISEAYVSLLSNQDFQRQVQGISSSPKVFFSLWPDATRITESNDCRAILTGFYRRLLVGNASSEQPMIFWDDTKRWSFKEAIFIDPIFEQDPCLVAAVTDILQRKYIDKIVTPLPLPVRKTFEDLEMSDDIMNHTSQECMFFQEAFFPNIFAIPAKVRDPLVHYCLEHNRLHPLLKKISCIPVSPLGKTLKKPHELIHPEKKAAALFTPNDERFPYGSFKEGYCLSQLSDLGMTEDNMSQEDYLERAKRLSSNPLESPEDLKQDRLLLEYLYYRLVELSPSWSMDHKFCDRLKKIRFLRTVYRQNAVRWSSRDIIYDQKVHNLVCEVAHVLDETQFSTSTTVKRFIGINCQPTATIVLQQFKTIIAQPGNMSNLRELCEQIYAYFDRILPQQTADIQSFFQSNKCILVRKKFVAVHQVAITFEEECVEPYLYRVPNNIQVFQSLLSAIKVRKFFSASDLVSTLQAFHDSTQGPLSLEEHERVMKVIRCLVKNNSLDYRLLPSYIFLPDSNDILKAASELSFCDLDWIPVHSVPGNLTHSDIPLSWAKHLGVRDVRQHIMDKYSAPIPGLATQIKQFGQREPLTNRIKRILHGYPCDDTILKELVQNADDSMATEIHLVLDTRNHGTKRLFSDKMIPLQGPALCVYNNRPFTDDDIEGIQRLGEGSKYQKTSCIGRFGVGFNSVYHITDCPSFLTNGDTLCIFDPNVKYLPTATEEYPGFMARPIDEEMKNEFQDIFNTYLMEHFDSEGSTMFRLPLRTESMARDSKISNRHTDVRDMQKLLKTIKAGLPEMLLFLTNVRKVSLSIINENGKLLDTHTVKASISESDECLLQKFVSTILKDESEKKPLKEVTVQSVYYKMKVTTKADNSDVTEEWLIQQQYGFKDPESIPHMVRQEYQDGSLQVRPIAGVAVPLTCKCSPAKAYCFLPMPICTGLPVHVNGYFELDHELRRNLWEGANDARGQWNQELIKQVLAPAYVQILCLLRKKLMVTTDNPEKSSARDVVEKYTSILPTTTEAKIWNFLVNEVYINISKCTVPLFPILARKLDSDKYHLKEGVILEWGMPFADMTRPGYFDTPIRLYPRLRSVVSDVGFPLIECSPSVHQVLNECAVRSRGRIKGTILEVTPEYLMIYFQVGSLVNVGLASWQLPQLLSETVIKNKSRLDDILRYCVDDEEFKKRLHNAPLLLTCDGQIRSFSRQRPVFKTKYESLVPSSQDEFMDSSIHCYFDEDVEVVKKFDIPALACRLTKELDPSKFNCNKILHWDKSVPNSEWIRTLWEFLADSGDQECVLQNLGHWSLLPSRVTTSRGQRYHLVPPSKASTVMNKLSIESDFHGIMKTLEVCEVDDIHFNPQTHQMIFDFVAAEEKPEKILLLFQHILQTRGSAITSLSSDQRDSILQYFAQHRPEVLLNAENSKIVKMLPCFKQIDGSYTSLISSKKLYVVEKGIPRMEMRTWMETYEAVFLEDAHLLRKLHKTMGCTDIEKCDVYTKFIFPRFSKLSVEVRMIHLKHVKHLFDINTHTVSQSMRLETLPLISDDAGNLKCGKEFYNRNHSVFRIMLPESKFVPKKTEKELGIEFLSKLGIQTEVSCNMFLEYATDIANRCTKRESDVNLLAEQSKSLVKELFKNCNLHTDTDVLARIKYIGFVVVQEPCENLVKIHDYFTEGSTGIPFEHSLLQDKKELVWTSVNLLPQYISHIHTCYPMHKRQEILENLGVLSTPKLESVILNTEKICHHVHNQDKPIFSPALQPVMEATYEFMHSKCKRLPGNRCNSPRDTCSTCTKLVEKLSHIPYVLIKASRHRLVVSHQICQQGGDLFQPHIYELPMSLGRWSRLFECLGSTRTPSFIQLAMVLNELSGHKDKRMKDPNMRKAVTTASISFFQKIQDIVSGTRSQRMHLERELQEVRELHFPIVPVGKLIASSQCFIKDNKDVSDRLKAEVPFIFDEVSRPFADFIKLNNIIPTHLRPRLISECITERMLVKATKECSYVQAKLCNFSKRMSDIIASIEFREAIQLLSRLKSDNTSAEAIQERHEKLAAIQIKCMDHLRTSLYLDEQEIEGSRAISHSFLSATDGNVILYITHTDDNQRSAYFKVVQSIAQNICQHVDDILRDHIAVVTDVLAVESPCDIPDTLRKHKIFDNQKSPKRNEQEDYPKLGARIPRDILHSLEQDPFIGFYKGEIVAFEIEAESQLNEMPVFVYAQIVDAPDNWLPHLHNQYTIDIGEEECIKVNGLNLYKFLVPESDPENDDMSLVVYSAPSDGQNEPTKPQAAAPPEPDPFPENLEEAMKQVTDQLEKIWRLEETLRRKAVRRLCLRWHPDKHPPERKDLATKVFQHLQNEIKRLESGRPRDSHRNDSSSSSQRSSYFDEDFFEFMRSWARSHDRSRTSYQEQFRKRAHHSHFRYRSHCPPSFDDSPQPDMPKARSWFKQAQFDYESSLNDLNPQIASSSSYDWTCYKCHHAAEKALKAAQLATRGVVHSSHNLIVLLSDLGASLNSLVVNNNVHKLQQILGDEGTALYPKSRVLRSSIPRENFSRSDAENARQYSNGILEVIKAKFKL